MKTCALLAGIMLVSGCGMVSERQIDAREYREVEQQAEYSAYKRKCREIGGFVVINGLQGRLGKSPSSSDYRCQRSLSLR